MHLYCFSNYIITFTSDVCFLCKFALLSGVTCFQSEEQPLVFLVRQSASNRLSQKKKNLF